MANVIEMPGKLARVAAAIHIQGAERHTAVWENVNRRAAEIVLLHGIDLASAAVYMPGVLLAVLDGLQIDQGLQWDAKRRRWI